MEIIAEIANAHDGRPEVAERLAVEAIKAGADAVKFQVYSPEELVVRTHSAFDEFRQLAFDSRTWVDLLRKVAHQGVRIYCDVFGLNALAVALQGGVAGYKVHSSDLSNDILLRAVAQTRLRVFLAVGASTFREIAHALSVVTAAGTLRPVLLYGFQSYPTSVEDTCLSRLRVLSGIYGERCEIGYMDHVAGGDPFGTYLPLIARGMGATVIEKHITLNRAARGTDYHSSLNPDEFAAFVAVLRRAELSLGENPERFSEAEKTYRQEVKKHWVTKRSITNNETVRESDLQMKRIETTGATVPLSELVDRRLVRDKAEESAVRQADVRRKVCALVIARMNSTRLPGKALLDFVGEPALLHLFRRLKQAQTLDAIVLCTTREQEDNALAELAIENGIEIHRGDTEDVLNRIVGAIDKTGADVVIRATGDNILVDPEYLDRAVKHHSELNAEYTDLRGLPDGTDIEIFNASLLRDLHGLACSRKGTEYLTTYVAAHPDEFQTASCPVDSRHTRNWRLTLDTPEDAAVIRALLEGMRKIGKAVTYRLDDVVEFFDENPAILALNRHVQQRPTPSYVMTELDWKRLV